MIIRRLASLTGALAVWLGSYPALAGAPAEGTTGAPAALEETRARLGLTLPAEVAGRDPVHAPLEILSRERCDQAAIADLGRALEAAGWRRDAARAHIAFSASCGGHAASLRAAASILLGLSDHTEAASVAAGIIRLEPYDETGYVLRAAALEKGHDLPAAIESYQAAIDLQAGQQQVASESHLGLARVYDSLGRSCDAAAAVETWVALDPARNDTGLTRAMIGSFRSKASCPGEASRKAEIFALARGHAVVPVTINGVKGRLMIDTGSTFVALRASFARRAGVSADPKSLVLLNTANGVTRGRRGRAATVSLRSLTSRDVPVVIQADANATYGRGVDGLLGMSFLSRFEVTMSGGSITVAPSAGGRASTKKSR